MKLYKIWQDSNTDWDVFTAAVVVAESEEEAVGIHPNRKGVSYEDSFKYSEDKIAWNPWEDMWVTPHNVHCEYIGEAEKSLTKGVILSSFRAG